MGSHFNKPMGGNKQAYLKANNQGTPPLQRMARAAKLRRDYCAYHLIN